MASLSPPASPASPGIEDRPDKDNSQKPLLRDSLEEDLPQAKRNRRTSVKKTSILPLVNLLLTTVRTGLLEPIGIPSLLKAATKSIFQLPRPLPQIWEALLTACGKCLVSAGNTVDGDVILQTLIQLSGSTLSTTFGSPDDVKALEDSLRTSLTAFLNTYDLTDAGTASEIGQSVAHTSTSSTIARTATVPVDAPRSTTSRGSFAGGSGNAQDMSDNSSDDEIDIPTANTLPNSVYSTLEGRFRIGFSFGPFVCIDTPCADSHHAVSTGSSCGVASEVADDDCIYGTRTCLCWLIYGGGIVFFMLFLIVFVRP